MDYSTYGAQQVNGFSTYGNQVTQEGSGGGVEGIIKAYKITAKNIIGETL